MNDSLHNVRATHETAPVAAQEATHGNAAPSAVAGQPASREQSRQSQPQNRPPQPRTTTAAADTVVDSVARPEAFKAIVLTRPAGHTSHTPTVRDSSGAATSWLILGLMVLFLLVALRYRRNFRFVGGMLSDLTSGRRRRNMFDDTVRETTFMILMNLLCVVSVGLLLAGALSVAGFTPAPRPGHLLAGIATCTGIVAIYYVCQWAAYLFIGYIFSTRDATKAWTRGFSSGQSLLGLLLFPLAMVSVFYPGGLPLLLFLASAAYLAARLLFIFKGIRIFSQQRHSYILFLYYLCSVEIVPAVIVWKTACGLCAT